MKHCTGCDTDKPLTEFYIWKSGPRIGKIKVPCRKCQTKYNATWQKRNPEKCRQKSSEYRYKHGSKPASENKSCSTYFGCVVAETVLSQEFPGFKRMPNCNPDFDYECPKGFTIDVKSSCRNHIKDKHDFWHFHIRGNKKVSFFLCIAWKDRKSLVPEHLWLIPGYLVNMKTGLTITDIPGVLAKWAKYERSLKNVLNVCDKMKEGDVHD